MRCNCSESPDTARGSTADLPFSEMEEVDFKSDDWVRLLKCSLCGQYWQVDEWDKYQVCIGIKVNDPQNWDDFDDLSYRMDHLLRARGGITEEICQWRDCEEYSLNDSAYCPRHTFEVAGLRE